MPLLTRARSLVLVGVTSLAVALPVSPIAPAGTAAAAPAASSGVVAQVSTGDRDSKASRSARSRAVAYRAHRVGMSLRGVPYRYGGSTPRGFDCSGFTSYVYRKAGVSLPRRASQQRRAVMYIPRSQARPGDLVFFHNSGGRVYHVGLYAGNNRTLHAPRPGQRVHVARIWTSNVSFGRTR
jgi:cell wall-associated NlpC family hydrolase